MGEPGPTTSAYEGFEGEVGRTMADSEPAWPERPSPRPGAPNVIVILVDDLGFSDIGCYGSEIDTPSLDRLAREGVRYTNFHVTPMCSPTRASLLTGLNPHLAGVGFVSHIDPGFPGYAMELAQDTATAAEILRDHGYATFMAGKWHLCKDSDISDGGSKHSWPVQRGFDHYYGILDGFTNLHHPHRLIEDNSVVDVDEYPEDFYLTDALTDRAIEWVRSVTVENPDKPFFLYLAHPAVHAPLQIKEEDRDRYRGAYEAGWDAIREARHRRQIELGIIAEDTPLPPRNSEPNNEVPAWDDLTEREQTLFARYMEIYAAMVADLDDEIGRLVGALDDLGIREDTLILFTSDNGASKEGEKAGTSQYLRTLMHRAGVIDFEDLDADWSRREDLGGPRTLPHYPRGWAMVGNTPFRLYKTNAHAGGHSVPMIMSWPGHLDETEELRRQYVHVTDVLPTLLDMIGIEAPSQREGEELKPMAGTSFAATLEEAGAHHDHDEQYIECEGDRAYRRGDWEIVTLHQPLTAYTDDEWELYDLASDPTQIHDLADEQPDRVRELAEAWEQAAWDNQVFPLDDGSGLKFVLRPDREERLEQPVTIVPGTPTLDRYRSLLLIRVRSFDVEIDLRMAAGDEGVLVAHGDQGGGYATYVEDGRLGFAFNAFGEVVEIDGGELPPGDHDILARLHAPGEFRWDASLHVDGEEVGRAEGLPLLVGMAPFEGIDVGVDRRSPVSWRLYERHGSFPWTGDGLRTVTYVPGDPAPEAADGIIEMMREIGRQIGQRYD